MFDVKNCLNECEEKMEMAAMYLDDELAQIVQEKPMCISWTTSV